MSDRRKLVACFARRQVSLSRACQLLRLSRRRLKYVPRKDDAELLEMLKMLAQAHPRWGVRQLWRQLRRRKRMVNLKRVRRLCRLHGLLLKVRRRRKRLGIGVGLPCRAEHPNHVWSYDFVEDRTQSGRKLRILTIVDEFTRRCIGIEVEHRMNAKQVAAALLKQFAVHGPPGFIRSDNGPEFVARFLMNVLKANGVEARHIDPGSPWQNGIDERFNGTLRVECLDLEVFLGLDHARAVIEPWRRHYNAERPHSGLGADLTPEEFYERWESQKQKAGCAGGEFQGLSHCASSGHGGGEEKGSGPSALEHDRPDDPRTIHVGAPVAPQQSRILRVDRHSVTGSKSAGTFPARKNE